MGKGIEFFNQQLKPALTTNNVTLYSTENEEKSSIVENEYENEYENQYEYENQ